MPEHSPHIIRVRQTTELASLISEILDSESETAYLLVDDSASLAHHALNLRLLKRESESAGKRVVLVSENPRIQHLAAQAALEVHQNTRIALALAQSPSSTPGGARGMADIVLPSEEDEEYEEEEEGEQDVPESEEEFEEGGEDEPEYEGEGSEEEESEEEAEEGELTKEDLDHIVVRSAYEEPPIHATPLPRGVSKKRFSIMPILGALASVAAVPIRGASGKPRVALTGLAVVSGAGLLFFLGAVVLPSATVKITPSTLEEEISYDVVADSNVSSPNLERDVVPAQILDEREEKTFTYKASGQENVETHATGNLTVYNEYSSDAQTLVAGTRFLSADGKLFRTTQTVVVPGAKIEGGKIIGSSIGVAIQADAVGDSFNIGPTTFSIPGFQGTDKYLAFYGKSDAPVEGGFSGVRAVATQEDIDKARAEVEKELLPVVEKRLREKVPEDLMLIEETFQVDLETMDVNVEAGSAADEFSVRAVARARAFLVREEQVREAIAAHLESAAQYNTAEYELGAKQDVRYGVSEKNFDDGIARLSLTVTQSFRHLIDTESLLVEIAGKKDVEVRRILAERQQDQQFEKVQVRFWPFWVHSVPGDPKDISVELEYPDEDD
jgi:hypothetical protein